MIILSNNQIVMLIIAVFMMFLVLFFYIVMAYVRLSNEYKELLEKDSKSDKKLERIREKQIAQAEEEAAKLISQAVKKSQEIIDSAGIVSMDVERSISERLEIVLKRQEEGFREKLLNFYDRLEVRLGKSAQDIEEKYESKLQENIFGMQEETRKVIKNTAQRVQENYQSLDDEIGKYKESRINIVNKEVEGIVREIAIRAFSESLTESQREKLVIRALEKAKQEGVFK